MMMASFDPVAAAFGIPLHSFFIASLMMAAVGALIFLVLRNVSLESWRLRSWLMAAILLQGLMIVRSPVHLGWIEASPAPVPDLGIDFDHSARAWLLPDAQSNEAAPEIVNGLAAASPEAAQRIATHYHWGRWLIAIWVGVAIMLVVIGLLRYCRVLRVTRKLSPAPDDWQHQWNRLRRRSRWLDRRVRCDMLISDSVGPLMIRRARGYSMVVPEDYWIRLTPMQRRGVMLHELAHLQRADVWRQLIARMIATMHWFNPIAWWALRQYETAAECACDQRVANDGKRAAAGFASALLDLVDWRSEREARTEHHRGLGFQTMAAPPLNVRISRLLKPRSTGDSSMKRFVLAALAVLLVIASFFQFRLTTAQENSEPDADAPRMRVMSEEVAGGISEIASRLDRTDPTTQRFHGLLDGNAGRIAVAGYLNALSSQSRDEARNEAIPRFVDHHFVRGDDGKLVIRSESADAMQRWESRSQRVARSIENIRRVTDDIATRLDTSTEAGGLFKRLLEDPQAPVAVLMNEMDGGDVISRYLAKALGQILVDQGDGTFVVVGSRREEAAKQIERFELADEIAEKLKRELPLLAAEYSTHDEAHQQFVRYLNNPLIATVAALEIAESVDHAARGVEQLHRHFEEASVDTAEGLQMANEKSWEKMREIYARVDRAAGILPRVRERLAEISDTLDTDDSLTARLATQMRREPAAVLLAAELPYAEADPGEELRAMLSEVLTESGDQLSIATEREQELAAKSRELLQICRKIRRYTSDIDQMMTDFADQEFVARIGEAGRYAMLDEVRRFAERHRPDPITLLRDDLLVQTDSNQLRVREDRREVVRQLVQQSEKVRDEAVKDDF